MEPGHVQIAYHKKVYGFPIKDDQWTLCAASPGNQSDRPFMDDNPAEKTIFSGNLDQFDIPTVARYREQGLQTDSLIDATVENAKAI
jgi:hypothetical protein